MSTRPKISKFAFDRERRLRNLLRDLLEAHESRFTPGEITRIRAAVSDSSGSWFPLMGMR